MTGAAREQTRRPFRRTTLAVALIVGLGIAFRLWLANGALGHTSSDGAVVGLMALDLLHHGELPAFYWGQVYGGSLEAILVTPWVWVFGTNTFALEMTSVSLGLTSSFLTWRIARHLFRPAAAASAGLISLFWPATLVWFGAKEAGFYPLTATLGLGAVLLAVNIDEQPLRFPLWLGLGLAIGVGWWMSPNIAYYAAPIAVWLVMRGHWKETRRVLIAAAGFVAGASVWIAANVQSGFDSLHSPPWGGSSTYLSRFEYFWRAGLPFSLGLRRPWDSRWYLGRYFGFALFVVVLLTVAVAFGSAFRTRVPDLYLIAASPFIYAAFVGNWHLYEGRYVYFIASMLPLLLGRVMEMRVGRVVVAVLVIVPGLAFMVDFSYNRSTIGPSTAPIAAALERAGFHTAVAEYAVAYRLTFESDERVIVIPASDDRHRAYVDLVRRSRPAYVFESEFAADDDELRRALDAHHIRYRVIEAGHYVAVLPSAPFFTAGLGTPIPR
jgi:4-amino-4-deoxy-L-arabinose transferase-like glycosyltransferase